MSKFDEVVSKRGRTIEAGETIFHQGEAGDTMYMIYSGRMEISRDQNGGKVVLAILGPGDHFGEMALIDQGPRSATVTALETCRLLPISRDFLLKHTRKDTTFIFAVMEKLAFKLEQTNQLLRAKYAGKDAGSVNLNPAGAPEPKSAVFLESFRAIGEKRDFKSLPPNALVFRQGDPGDSMYIILNGTVRIAQEEGGKRFILAEFGRGDFFGEMALIADRGRTATAQALTSTLLMPVDKEFFIKAVKAGPEAALHVVQVLILRLRRALQVLA